jgi:hypothetical protein
VLLLASILALGLGLVGVALVASVAFLLLQDGREDARTVGARTVRRRRAWVDPNEAARAVGSWG